MDQWLLALRKLRQETNLATLRDEACSLAVRLTGADGALCAIHEGSYCVSCNCAAAHGTLDSITVPLGECRCGELCPSGERNGSARVPSRDMSIFGVAFPRAVHALPLGNSVQRLGTLAIYFNRTSTVGSLQLRFLRAVAEAVSAALEEVFEVSPVSRPPSRELPSRPAGNGLLDALGMLERFASQMRVGTTLGSENMTELQELLHAFRIALEDIPPEEVLPPQLAPRPRVAMREPIEPESSKQRVLFLPESPDVERVVVSVIESGGFELVSTSLGEASGSSGGFDLLIADHAIAPDLSADEFLSVLRSRVGADLPCVLLSSEWGGVDVGTAFCRARIVRKPVSSADLILALRLMLDAGFPRRSDSGVRLGDGALRGSVFPEESASRRTLR